MLIDGLEINEGSVVTNLTIPTGTSFPVDRSNGELFYRTDSPNIGFYVYDSTTLAWAQLSDGSTIFGGTGGSSATGNGNDALINGDMEIWQRNSSFTGLPATFSYTADRFTAYQDGGNTTVSRSTDVPTGEQYRYSAKIVEGTGISPASTNQYHFGQKIEGTVISKYIGKVLRFKFWIKSAVTGSYTASMFNTSFSHAYDAEFTISAANTWEEKTVTIDLSTVPTSITLDNTYGVYIAICLMAGSSRKSGGYDAWLTPGFTAGPNQVNALASPGNEIYITGMRLQEDGSPEYRRSFAEQLDLCQRYYNKTYSLDTIPGTTNAFPGMIYHIAASAASGAGGAPGGVAYHHRQPVPMRTTPSITVIDRFGNTGSMDADGASSLGASVFENNEHGCRVTNATTVSDGGGYTFHVVSDAEL